jgi:hypothetical protein
MPGLNGLSLARGPIWGGVQYELRAWPPTGTPNQAYTDGQVLDAIAEGVHPGQLTVVEVDGTLSVASNALAYTAQATPVWGDQGVYSQAIDRVLGKGLLGVVNVGSTATSILPLSWQTVASLALNSNDSQFFFGPGSGLNARVGTASTVIAIYTANTDYNIGLILGGYDVNSQPWYAGQNPLSYLYGAAWYVKGGSFSTWTLLWRTELNNTATLYAALSNFDAAGTLQNFRVVSGLSAVLQPAALSTFTAANGTSLDAITPEVGGLWTGATWDIQGNQARNTPTEGGELVTNGDFSAWTGDDPDGWTVLNEDANNYVTQNPVGQCQLISDNSAPIEIRQSILSVGSWYAAAVDCTASIDPSVVYRVGNNTASILAAVQLYFATVRASTALVQLFRSGACNVTFDNVSVKQLTLSSLFASITTSHQNGTFDRPIAVDPDGTQCGMVINLDSAGSPANFVIAYHDGTNCLLEKCVAGTYTTMITAATAFVADAVLRVIKDGTSYSLYYNGAQVGATVAIADAGVIDNQSHGLFSTNDVNRIEYSADFFRTSDIYDCTLNVGECGGGDVPPNDALLLENGDNILLESGDKILLENFN